MISEMEKYDFVREMVGNVEAHLLRKLEFVPEHWDGVELRQWIVDKFAERVLMPSAMSRKRLKDYRNDVLVNNL